ncbi:MAG: hypothetical protein ACR2OF_00030 [Hyphomicrobium sp.]
MDDYHFWQDFFDTYQSLSNGTKALWLIVPPAFLLGLIALILRHRVAVKDAENGMRGDLVYTIHRDADDQLHVYRHGPRWYVLSPRRSNPHCVAPSLPSFWSAAVLLVSARACAAARVRALMNLETYAGGNRLQDSDEFSREIAVARNWVWWGIPHLALV